MSMSMRSTGMAIMQTINYAKAMHALVKSPFYTIKFTGVSL